MVPLIGIRGVAEVTIQIYEGIVVVGVSSQDLQVVHKFITVVS